MITDDHWEEFVNENNVCDDIIEFISIRIVSGSTLTEREVSIYKEHAERIENYIKKIKEKAKAQAASELLQKEFQKQIENEIAIQKKQEQQLAKVAERQKEVNELDESIGRAGDIDKQYIAKFEQPDVKATSPEPESKS